MRGVAGEVEIAAVTETRTARVVMRRKREVSKTAQMPTPHQPPANLGSRPQTPAPQNKAPNNRGVAEDVVVVAGVARITPARKMNNGANRTMCKRPRHVATRAIRSLAHQCQPNLE